MFIGCLQSVYGIHTFRVESIAHGKAAPVDELQVQGIANPSLLKKVIVTEAAKVIQETTSSPYQSSVERRGIVPGDLLLQKLDEVNKSVKKIEFLVEKSRDSPEGS
ncbi:uncharacterized protein LOC116135879 isoform X2 [Pistacia vera]|uniref:uncharacterized protein LOC116135879 isoform X2 n=1 Tax=Pistacia vera TaxID=55513 RepID=UPI0012633C40|nr:uncharacterized protein LOC116135879 isoform X2 [Pistacia vera]